MSSNFTFTFAVDGTVSPVLVVSPWQSPSRGRYLHTLAKAKCPDLHAVRQRNPLPLTQLQKQKGTEFLCVRGETWG